MSTQKTFFPKIIFCLLLSASLSLSAGIDAPTEVKVEKGKLFRLEVTQVEGKPLLYKATDESNLFVDELVSKSGKLRLIGQGNADGVYFIAFSRDGEIVFTKITVGTIQPIPDDNKPKPTPFSGKLKAYLITESADKNIAYSKIFSSKTVSDYWTSHQYILPVIADPNTVDPATNQTPTKLKPYIDRAKGKKDQLYLVDISTGTVLFEGDAPQTAEGLLSVVGGLK